MFYYAQIDNSDICTAISCLNGEVISGNMIRLEYCDYSLVGKKYVGEGQWVDVIRPEEPLTEAEQIMIENTLNIEYLVCLAESSL